MSKPVRAGCVLLAMTLCGCNFDVGRYRYDLTYIPPPCSSGFTPPDASKWQQVSAPCEVTVYARREIYTMPERGKSYVRIRLVNTTEREFAVDPRDYFGSVRPMDWSLAGRRATAQSMPASAPADWAQDRQKRRQMIHDYFANKLIPIPPKSAVDYFHDFDSDNVAADVKDKQSLTVALAGKIWATDGVCVEVMTMHPGQQSRIVVPYNADRPMVPMGAVVLDAHGPTLLVPTTSASQPESP